jgi:carbonic anhydrase
MDRELEQKLRSIQEKLGSSEDYDRASKAKSPQEALQLLLEGNRRYLSEAALRPNSDVTRRLTVVEGQKPFAAILGCADSRVPPEILFDYGLGDLFIVRVAGNVPDESVLGSLEYAAAALEVPLILVLGHGGCGAVKAAVKLARDGEDAPGHIGMLARAIKPAVRPVLQGPGDTLERAIKSHVRRVAKSLPEASPILAELLAAQALDIVGAYYDLRSGAIELLDGSANAYA